MAVPHAVPKAFGVGTLAGVLGSLVGMGGGFVMIPLMTSNILRLSQHSASGTSLFAVAATGISGAIGYGLHDLDLESAAAIAFSGMITARLGAITMSKMSGKSLKTGLGIYMLMVAPIVPAKSYIVEYYGSNTNTSDIKEIETKKKVNDDKVRIETEPFASYQKLVAPGIIGLGSGFLAGLFGVGGGAVVVPALTIFTDMNHYQALGTSLCAMALPALIGTITHYQKGNIAPLRIAGPLASGSFIGAYFGGRLGLTIPEDTLRWGFSGLMITLGARTLLRR